MTTLIKVIIIASLFATFFFVKYLVDRYKNFDDIIEGNIQRKGWKLLKSEYSGLFNTGPFDKIEKDYKSKDLKETIMSDKVYYRKLTLHCKKKGEFNMWAKIAVKMKEYPSIEFYPHIDSIN